MLHAVMDRIIVDLDKEDVNQVIYTGEKKIRNTGTVVSVGPMVDSVQKGDRIIFHKFDELPLPDKDQVVVRESSVLGIYID